MNQVARVVASPIAAAWSCAQCAEPLADSHEAAEQTRDVGHTTTAVITSRVTLHRRPTEPEDEP